jgi:hypothetical protein
MYRKLNIDNSRKESDDLEYPKLNGIDRWVSIPGVASIVYWVKWVFGTTLVRPSMLLLFIDGVVPPPQRN